MPSQGSNPWPLQWKCGILTTGPPGKSPYLFSFMAFFSPQSCLQRIHRGLVFYEKLLGSDIFTGEPSLLPDGPVDQLHASILGLRELLQV